MKKKILTTVHVFIQGILKCRLFASFCPEQKCFLFGGEREGIFFLSKNTGCGDEIGWDFVDQVIRGRMSFTAFCNLKTKDYKTTHFESGPFMGVVTFLKWFFSWIVAMKIDFRKEIDPFCGHDPSMLVCDGTHIGVSYKLSRMTSHNAISRPDVDKTVKPLHKK